MYFEGAEEGGGFWLDFQGFSLDFQGFSFDRGLQSVGVVL
jgi:hypothetical protein